MPSKEKETKAKYISKYLNLRLVDRASYTKEVEGRVVVVTGKAIQFADGLYETSDPDKIKFLDSHPNCGNVFIRVKDSDLKKARDERFKDLEAREKELDEKEKKLARKEKELEDKGEDDVP